MRSTNRGYLGPDVVTRFDTIALAPDGPDRVRVSGVRGAPPPATLKVCCNTLQRIPQIARLRDLRPRYRGQGRAGSGPDGGCAAAAPPDEMHWTLARTDHPDSDDEEAASALLHCTVRDADPAVAGRGFSARAVEIGLGSYPGFHLTSSPGDASPVGVYHAGFIPTEAVEHVALLDDGSRIVIPPAPASATIAEPDAASVPLPEPLPAARTQRRQLGTVVGARSGDKGGNANLGVWARNDASWRWLAHTLTVDALKRLLPETAHLRGAPSRPRQPARAELRHRRTARRGCRLVHAFRPAGEGARGMAPLAHHRHTRGTPMTDTELVHLTVDQGIATVTLDSPHNRNALSRQLVAELTESCRGSAAPTPTCARLC